MEVLAARWHQFECLSSKLGQPVWPISAEEDLQFLARFVNARGAQIRFVEACAPVGSRTTVNYDLDEFVVSTSAQAYPACLVYAHLTGRRPALVSRRDLASFSSTVAVLITVRSDFQGITEADLRHIGSRQNFWPGLIMGESENELRRAVLLKAAALFLDCVGSDPDLTVYPHLDVGVSDTPSRKVVDATSVNARTEEILSNNYNIISIYTHGDGTDLRWGEKPICSIPRLIGTITPSINQPSCVTYNKCYRLNESLDSEPAHSQTVDPRLLRAKVLVLASCWGIQVSPTVIDSRWSIANSLSTSENLVAFLATVDAAILNPQQVEQLYLLLATRETIGIALREFNAKQFAVGSGVCFHLCGDPGTCARTLSSAIVTIDWPLEEPKTALARDFPGLLREITGKQDSEQNLSRRKIYNGEYTESEPTAIQTRARDLELLRTLAEFGSLPNRLWRPYATFESAADGGNCPFCGSSVTHLKFDVAHSNRALYNCYRCGIIGDLVPDRCNISVDWAQLSITLDKRTLERGVVAILLVETDWKIDTELIEFIAIDSKLALVRPVGCDRFGFFYLTVFLHDGEDVAVFRRSGFRKNDGRLTYFNDELVSGYCDL
jgi:hypothetical protein